ncbi:unnamed protein product [Miscanthus lutarioriparius]|uniref:F-box protein n=1 Tax=Miscanthus lutarioriparius TaxID=422564 RepID=A0A811Q5N0_9POAL|nr:unnamed protein product [Miscanthus lutarioriparius]
MAAALQAQRLFLTASTSSSSSSSSSLTTWPRRTTAAPCRAGLRVPSGVQTTTASSIPADGGLKLDWIDVTTTSGSIASSPADRNTAVDKLRAVAEAAADRAEMHDIIGRQRDNWNHLLLHSTNSLTLAASVMAALGPAAPGTVAALKASAGVLLATAAVTMAAVNRVQPSQLAEEQRNATRLWRQLERDVRATLQHEAQQGPRAGRRVPAAAAPGDAGEVPQGRGARAVVAAPPSAATAEEQQHHHPVQELRPPRRPHHLQRVEPGAGGGDARPAARAPCQDEHQYLTVGKLVLSINRGLAVAGPALAGTAAVAAAFIGTGDGAWASGAAAAACGALAAAVNTVEHGAQLGMLFELLRNCAGFYRKVQEDIEAALGEADVERRENGEVFRTKVALLLGRDAAELRQFRRMASASVKDDDIKDYAGKLF